MSLVIPTKGASATGTTSAFFQPAGIASSAIAIGFTVLREETPLTDLPTTGAPTKLGLAERVTRGRAVGRARTPSPRPATFWVRIACIFEVTEGACWYDRQQRLIKIFYPYPLSLQLPITFISRFKKFLFAS